MARRRLADTAKTIAFIQDGDRPLEAEAFGGAARLVRAWRNLPIDAYVPAVQDHILAPVLRGEGDSSVTIEGRRFAARSRAGAVTILPKGRDGQWRCPGRPVCSNVYLADRQLRRCAEQLGRTAGPELLVRVNTPDPTLFRILKLMTDEPASDAAADRLFQEQLVDLLCVHLLRAHSEFPLSPPVTGALAGRQVRKVLDYMRDHLDEAVSVRELADLLRLSRFHFCTAFRKATGRTPHDQLVWLRMERARDLLRHPGPPITEIALAVGYQTPSAFSLAFRKATGVTPTAYRREA